MRIQGVGIFLGRLLSLLEGWVFLWADWYLAWRGGYSSGQTFISPGGGGYFPGQTVFSPGGVGILLGKLAAQKGSLVGDLQELPAADGEKARADWVAVVVTRGGQTTRRVRTGYLVFVRRCDDW
ncbi:uncharacterized protein MKK02DRAFT_27879 [Dioszegia hungarica]|uniref:Uncharacterized protein n=1 Tax=Dioszegia hungarica TaxID=4972 RepID=A0AA38H8E0_9TREE|nr:uncharacterized protein MKK02DRAFT_27879 [Dioszegia hungarica]KAI9634721.1 hypothetical protein MKK02DRAFT_27879 [Dioszegia hungarica]